VINVVDVESTVGDFATAEVNFYMPGVTADNNVAVRQLVNGAWEEVGVAEVREDHVVVEMTGLGTLMFVQQ
jgi:hypothetical protein